ncbi:MAG: glycosyltransferase family 2 protein [Gemmatimonadota bacterium]
MKLKLAEVELSERPAEIPGLGGHDGVRALVRHRSRPLGWVTMLTRGLPSVPWPAFEQALRAQLGPELVRAWLATAVQSPAPGPLPPVTVVVCTRDRATLLEGCLRAVQGLAYPAFEVVVVDNAPSDGVTEAVACAFGVRYVREDRPGLNWARNRGVLASRHDIVAFTDDDARPDRLWLRALSEAFADPEVMLVTGLVAPAALETPAQLLFELGEGGMGKGMRRRSSRPASVRAFDLLQIHDLGVGANVAMRVATWQRVGGFDTALDVGTPAGGAGDLDFFHRTLAAGLTVVYEPGALVWHCHRDTMNALRRVHRDNGRSFGVYLLKVWESRTVPRQKLLQFALRRWGRWVVRQLVLALLKRGRLPVSLASAELRGVLQAPFAFRAARRSDARLRARSREEP